MKKNILSITAELKSEFKIIWKIYDAYNFD